MKKSSLLFLFVGVVRATGFRFLEVLCLTSHFVPVPFAIPNVIFQTTPPSMKRVLFFFNFPIPPFYAAWKKNSQSPPLFPNFFASLYSRWIRLVRKVPYCFYLRSVRDRIVSTVSVNVPEDSAPSLAHRIYHRPVREAVECLVPPPP